MPATAFAPVALVPRSRPNSGLNLASTPVVPPVPGFSGVTAFRRPGVAWPAVPATPVGSSTGDLVADAVDAALLAIARLERESREAALRFRARPDADAQRRLAHLVESTESLMALAQMAAGATDADLADVCACCDAPDLQTPHVIATLVRRQLTHDWDEVADALERPFPRVLAAWRRVFALIGGAFNPDPVGQAA